MSFKCSVSDQFQTKLYLRKAYNCGFKRNIPCILLVNDNEIILQDINKRKKLANIRVKPNSIVFEGKKKYSLGIKTDLQEVVFVFMGDDVKFNHDKIVLKKLIGKIKSTLRVGCIRTKSLIK